MASAPRSWAQTLQRGALEGGLGHLYGLKGVSISVTDRSISIRRLTALRGYITADAYNRSFRPSALPMVLVSLIDYPVGRLSSRENAPIAKNGRVYSTWWGVGFTIMMDS